MVAFDAPFYGVAPLLPARHAARMVNVARATAALHGCDDHERITWERDGLLATAHAGGRVAATSRHIRQHLAGAYGIPSAAVPGALVVLDKHPSRLRAQQVPVTPA